MVEITRIVLCNLKDVGSLGFKNVYCNDITVKRYLTKNGKNCNCFPENYVHTQKTSLLFTYDKTICNNECIP